MVNLPGDLAACFHLTAWEELSISLQAIYMVEQFTAESGALSISAIASMADSRIRGSDND